MSASGKPASKAGAQWVQERERGKLWILLLMRWIAMTLGRTVSRWLLYPIALYFFCANRKARTASRSYLARVWGRPATWQEVVRHIHRFTQTVLDRVYFLRDQFHQFDITTVGAELLHQQMERGDGVFLVGAHFGSFEALRASAQTRGARAAMLMFEDNARLINAALAAIAPAAQLHVISLGRPGSMLALRRWLDEGGLAGMLADRTLPGQSERAGSRWLDFLGRPAHFSDGPFRLAAMMRRPVVFMAGIYHGGRSYELRFNILADFSERADDTNQQIDQAMRRYVATLEALCLESPYNWFNFFDFWAAAPNPPHDPASSTSADAS